MSLEILGMGTALPTHSIAQSDAANLANTLACRSPKESKLLEALYKRTRIQNRGSVLLQDGNGPNLRQSFFPVAHGPADLGPTTGQRMHRYAEEAAPLALAASRRALRESGLAASRISDLITVSCTGFTAPGVDIALIKALGLSKNVGRMQLGFMGCHGSLNGLRIASALVEANPESRVLLCAIELCSLHFSYAWDTEKIVANGLFADGAAALIAGPEKKTKHSAWRVQALGSCLFPDSESAMTWRIGDHGFEMTLSNRVPSLIASHLRPALEEWLALQKLMVEDIRSWAIHPGGPRLLDEVATCLHLPEAMLAASREILQQHGNMSSPTLLFILERLRQEKAPTPCVALGFGPGLTVEMALLRD